MNRIIWTCLHVMSKLTTSTASNLWLFKFHISKLLSTFNMRFSNWSTWTGWHQFRLWNVIGYIPRTLAGDRFNKNAICTFEILQAIKDRTEICFMQFSVSKNCNYVITWYLIMVKPPATTHLVFKFTVYFFGPSTTTFISTVDGITKHEKSMLIKNSFKKICHKNKNI